MYHGLFYVHTYIGERSDDVRNGWRPQSCLSTTREKRLQEEGPVNDGFDSSRKIAKFLNFRTLHSIIQSLYSLCMCLAVFYKVFIKPFHQLSRHTTSVHRDLLVVETGEV
jgi:hypothetical protein